VSGLHIAEPDCESPTGFCRPGFQIADVFGCWRAAGGTSRGVSKGDGACSPASERCPRSTDPAAPQHVGVGRVTDCDDPDGKGHEISRSLTPIGRGQPDASIPQDLEVAEQSGTLVSQARLDRTWTRRREHDVEPERDRPA